MTAPSAIVGTTCQELALEGLRLCKEFDHKNGVKFLEEAVKVGARDEATLAPIVSQLGLAYFHLGDYNKAIDCHLKDVALCHSIGDELAEGKACANLGNTYKMVGKFDEAAMYCRRYLEISKKLKNEEAEGRALYNLGNIYHCQGKQIIFASEEDPGELSIDTKASIEKAIEYYNLDLQVVTKLQDYNNMGKVYGQLGSCHYLLGNFEKAIEHHKRRLEIAVQLDDLPAQRRAQLNLAHANTFIANHYKAIEHYLEANKLAQQIQDLYMESHAIYGVALSYYFLGDFKSAESYLLKYLDRIKEFDDKLGEARAFETLIQLYQKVDDLQNALLYAKKHLEFAESLGDIDGANDTRSKIEELESIIAQRQSAASTQHLQQANSIVPTATGKKITPDSINGYRLNPEKRIEHEHRRFRKQINSVDGLGPRHHNRGEKGAVRSSSSERLFDMIAHFQSGRIDDQRCEMMHKTNKNVNAPKSRINDNKENFASSDDAVGTSATGEPSAMMSASRASQPTITNPLSVAKSAIKATYRKASLVAYPTTQTPSIQSQRRPTVSAEHRDQLFELIAGAQNHRMDEQRATLPAFSMPNGVLRNPTSAGLLSRGYTVDQSAASGRSKITMGRQSEVLAESIPESSPRESSLIDQPARANVDNANPTRHKLTRHFQTVDSDGQVHDEKFLDSLMKYQSTRFNDQRSEFPKKNSNSAAQQPEQNQADNFFNLIHRFQSDRIDDQRSTPPRNKNI